MKLEGVITVFLSMIFLVIVSLVFTTVESARVQATRMVMETGVDAAMESMLAGYDRSLYEDYDVFFFDGSYGAENVSVDQLAAELNGYLETSLHPEQEILEANTDFYKLSAEEASIGSVALATDDNGSVFRSQAIASMRTAMGVDIVEKLVLNHDWAVENIEDGSFYEEQEEEVEHSLISLQDEKAQVDCEKSEEAARAESEEDLTEEVMQMKSAGILELTHPSPEKISKRCVSVNQLPSHRKLNQGNGLVDYECDIASTILFDSYLMDKFVHAATEGAEDNGNLRYELEYLLIGEGSDVDNLKGVVNRLLLMREGANFAYLLTDAGKVAEAYEAAMLLVGYTLIPPLIEATKYSLLLAWAYAESVLDVKVLLAGERNVLVKTKATWRTKLSNLGEISSMNPKQMGNEEGLNYGEYLQLMLSVADQNELSMRALDIIELNIRNKSQCSSWKIDNCVAAVQAIIPINTESMLDAVSFVRELAGQMVVKNMTVTRRFAYDIWQ